MKKILTIAVITLAFASCKKDYTCTCKVASVTVATIKANSTNNSATAWCSGIQTEMNSGSSGTNATCSVQ
ncbi:MAG: hypothetical protein JSU07_07100 [Bacteroidetes bacterium]|nr:hypothetical protein [Bacteroidota bacterium]